MSVEGQSCSNCLYWQHVEHDRGCCCRHAPSPLVRDNPGMGVRVSLQTVFPPSYETWWCGDWGHKPVIQVSIPDQRHT